MSSLRSLLKFQAWANAELLEALGGLDANEHAATLTSCLRTFNHIHVVDRIFQAHLQGLPHEFTDTNTPQTLGLAEFGRSVRSVDEWYVDYAGRLAQEQLSQRLSFRFTDGDLGCMNRGEMLLHVVAHGAYHRGAIGERLDAAGKAPPRELLTRFLHRTEPDRREGV